jgi:hypothetical protein
MSDITNVLELVRIALGVSVLGFGASIYAVVRAHKAVTPTHLDFVRAQAVAPPGTSLTAECVHCRRSVARFSVTLGGAVCANCKPLPK